MFPFGHSGEISFQATENEQDLILDNHLLEAANLSTATATATTKGRGRGRGRGQKAWVGDVRVGGASASGVNGVGMIDLQDDDDKMKMNKKMVHRDIERQRRNEMSSLFSTLHSLLPLQYAKGKRSTSDHVAESVNYIKDLQNNIKVLGDKRDNLLKLLHDGNYGELATSSTSIGCNIDIYSNAVGPQVQIVACQSPDGFALSTTLKVLHEEGLDVVNCVSNTANGIIHHNIQCQVNEATCDYIDIERLRQRLYAAVY